MKRLSKILSVCAFALALSGNGIFASPGGNEPKLPVTQSDTVFYENFNDGEAVTSGWLIVDNNNDNSTWSTNGNGSGVAYTNCLSYRYSSRQADDYAISPLFELKADRTYKLSYFYNNLYQNERVEVYIGNARTVEAMTTRLHRQEVTTYGFATVVFSVEEDGQYSLGIKAVSDPASLPGLYVDEVTVTQEILGAVPQPVQNLVQVPAADGAIGMQLKWTNPSLTEAGTALPNLTAIEIYKNYGNTAQTYSLSLEPGASVTWIDPAPKAGKVTYHVYAVNENGRSYAAQVNTFVGEDLPSAPRNLKAEAVSGSVKLSWDAPGEFGLNGGWYDKNNLTYIVARTPNYTVVNASTNQLTLTDAVENMDLYYYEVSAKNSFGQGAKATSAGIRTGTSMQLPFHEDFENPARLEQLWTVVDVKGDKATWAMDPARGYRQPGAVFYNWLLAGTDSDVAPIADDWLFTPLMKFEAGKKYRLRYSLKGVMMNDINLRISIGKTANATAMTTVLEHLREHGTTGAFEDRSVEFTSPGSGSFCIGFYYYDRNIYTWLDDIWVEEIAGNDLAVNRIKGTSAPKAGETVSYTFFVENKGTAAARNFKLQLLDQSGNVLASGQEITRPLSAGRTSEYTVNWIPANTSISTLRGRVEWSDDAVAGNNTSPELTLKVQGEGAKAVQVGDGEVTSYAVPWYVYNTGFGQTVYPSSLLGGVMGKLECISYQLMAGLEDTLRNQNFRVWVGETDRYDMSAGWFGPDELTCVFDSTVEIVSGIYDWYLDFQRPYDYKGGNLVVCIEGANAYGNLGGFGMYFYCTETGSNAVHRSNYSNRLIDMQNLDNTQGKFFSIRPNTTFFFDVNGMGALEGTVKDSEGAALANVKVAVDGIHAVQRSAADGKYKYPYLPAGSRNVSFTTVGYEDVTQTVTISDKQISTLDVTMQNRPEVKVSGVIVGSDDPHKGLPLAELTLDGPSDYTVVTDENGCFTIEKVYGNLEYTAQITASGYSDYAGPLAVGSSDLETDTIVLAKMVNMPSAVVAYDKTDYALVEWSDPVPVAWLQLDKGEMYGAFGGNSDAGYLVAHRYTPEDFSKEGITSSSAVTKVRFFPMAVANFTLQVFVGEDNVESLVLEEEMDVEEYETWYEYDLKKPVAIDPKKNMMIAIKVQQSSGSNPVGFDRGPALSNASLFSEDGGLNWVNVSAVSPTMNYNWIIHTYCSANPNSMPTDPVELQNRPAGSPAPFLSEYGSSQTLALPGIQDAEMRNTGEITGSYTFELLTKSQRKRFASMSRVENQADAVYEYEVYRLLNGQEEDRDSWTKITGFPIEEMSVRDENWKPLYDTMYRYAVRSLMDGASSDYTFSRTVDKGKYATASLKVVTNTGESAAGAVVQVKGKNNSYTDTVAADGLAVLENIHFGTYELSVRKEWYNTYTRQEVVLDTNTVDLGSVTLIEDVRPPKNFKATDWIDYVDLSWSKPEKMIEAELTKTASGFSAGYGMNYGGIMEVGQRFTPEELQQAGVDGFYLNAISFWPDASADFTVKVWKSDIEGQEKEAYAQTVTSDEIVLGEWNTVTLDYPVLINADQYYIFGYSANMSGQAYPCGADHGPLAAGGDLLFYEGEWASFCGFAPTMYNFNWMIRASVSNTSSVSKELGKADEDLDYTYELYRFAQKDSASTSAWTKLSGDNFKDLQYTDQAWKTQADGNYYYAVYSRSEAGNTSDTVVSALLPKGQVSLVTVSATTNNGASAEGAVVALVSTGADEKSFGGVLDASGSVEIPAVLKGSYTLHIVKEHFEEVNVAVDIADTRTSLTGYVLKESMASPLTVRALHQEGEQVRVDWWSPMSTGAYPHYIGWNTDEFFTGIGQGANAFNFSAAHKYTPLDLEEKRAVGTYVTKIRFFVASTDAYPTQATFKVGIWEGDEGLSVHTQSVPASAIKLNSWVEVTLAKPYYIDGTKTVMFGYTCNATQGWVGGVDYGPALRGKGNMINVDGTWMTITALSPDLDYNWMIETYCTDGIGAGVSAAKAETEDFVKGYSVYRLRESDMTAPDRWTELKNNTTETTCNDNLSGLPDDWYMYAVKAIYATGESDYRFSDRLGKGVGNEEQAEAGEVRVVTIYPNPNRGSFSMELPFDGMLKICDLEGKSVWQREMEAGLHEMDLKLPAGNYVIVLTGSSEQANGRIVIVR